MPHLAPVLEKWIRIVMICEERVNWTEDSEISLTRGCVQSPPLPLPFCFSFFCCTSVLFFRDVYAPRRCTTSSESLQHSHRCLQRKSVCWVKRWRTFYKRSIIASGSQPARFTLAEMTKDAQIEWLKHIYLLPRRRKGEQERGFEKAAIWLFFLTLSGSTLRKITPEFPAFIFVYQKKMRPSFRWVRASHPK